MCEERCAASATSRRAGYAEEDHVARIGTEKRPAVLRVQTERRAQEVANICGSNGIHFIIGLEPDKPEDVSDMDRARCGLPSPPWRSPRSGAMIPARAAAARSSRSAAPPRYPRAPEKGETRVRT